MSHTFSGKGNLSSTGGMDEGFFVFELTKGSSSTWHYEVHSNGSDPFYSDVKVYDAKKHLNYYGDTILEYYDASHNLEHTFSIGAVRDPIILANDTFDIILGNEKVEGSDVRTVVKKINSETGDIVWSTFIKDEPSKITDAMFADHGSILIAGIELASENTPYVSALNEDGTIAVST